MCEGEGEKVCDACVKVSVQRVPDRGSRESLIFFCEYIAHIYIYIFFQTTARRKGENKTKAAAGVQHVSDVRDQAIQTRTEGEVV